MADYSLIMFNVDNSENLKEQRKYKCTQRNLIQTHLFQKARLQHCACVLSPGTLAQFQLQQQPAEQKAGI